MGPAYLRVCSGYSAVVWPGMAGLALAAEPVVRILYGEAWIGVAPLLAMIALSEILLVSLPLHTDLPILAGKLNQLIRVNMLDTILAVTLLIAGSRWGVEGAAASRLVYAVGWVLLYARFLHRLIGFDLRELMGIYARSAIATLAALLPLALTYMFLIPPSLIGFFALAAASGAGVVLWLLALIVLKHPALDDLVGMAAHLPVIGRFRLIAKFAR